MNKNTTWI